MQIKQVLSKSILPDGGEVFMVIYHGTIRPKKLSFKLGVEFEEKRKDALLPSLKLTWHLKIHPWKRRFLWKTINF